MPTPAGSAPSRPAPAVPAAGPAPSGAPDGVSGRPVLLTRRLSGLLLGAGAFQWLVWPNFLRVVWRDPRAFDASGPTAFLIVHLAIVGPALVLGSALLWLGARGWRRAPR